MFRLIEFRTGCRASISTETIGAITWDGNSSRFLDYLSLWPHGVAQLYVSTLNALDGAITSNMAIVPTNDGNIDAFTSRSSKLILDLSGYFAPSR